LEILPRPPDRFSNINAIFERFDRIARRLGATGVSESLQQTRRDARRDQRVTVRRGPDRLHEQFGADVPM
jgi:hypothetical protein